MASSVNLSIVMKPGWEREVQQLPQLKDALTVLANEKAQAANSMSAGFKTKEATIKGEKKGGKSPIYLAKKAEYRGSSSVALVVTGNYAAIKDNYEHNTLLKTI